MSAKSTGDSISQNEELIYLIHAPKMVNGGEIAASAYMGILNSGLSVLRKQKASAEEIENLAWYLVKRQAENIPDSEYSEITGVIEFAASIVKIQITSDHNRKFCIYDTPTLEEPSHADILMTMSNWSSKGKARSVAADFFKNIFDNYFISSENYRFAKCLTEKEVGDFKGL